MYVLFMVVALISFVGMVYLTATGQLHPIGGKLK